MMGWIGWVAIASSGFAVWMWLPEDGMIRLRPPTARHLPAWAEPLPGAMAARRRWWIAGLTAGAVVIYGGLSWLVCLLAPLIAGAVWIGLGRLEPGSVRRRRLATLRELPQGLDLIQACLRSGQPLRQAVDTVARAMGPPLEEILGAVTHAVSVGMSDSQAWQVLQDDPIVGAVARDVVRSATWGTTTSDVLAQHSADLRRSVKAESLAGAKAVGVRSVLPLGLCYLPAFVLIGVVPVIAAGLAGFLS